MKPIIRKLGLLVAMLLAVLPSSAYDFEVDGICYTITSTADLTVSVDGLAEDTISKLTIPPTVEYKGRNLTVTKIANKALANKRGLTEIILPETVSVIETSMCYNDTALIRVKLPKNISTMGGSVFNGCRKLETVELPSNLTSIPKYTFNGCTSLNNVAIPDNVSSIGDAAFQESGITQISLPKSLYSIGVAAFSATKIQYIEIPDNVETIPSSCFRDCSELKDIVFSSSNIKEYAFYNCDALQTISLPQNLQSIGDYAFAECDSLFEFSIPSNVNQISPSILWDCPNLTKLKIGCELDGLPFYHNYDNGRHTFMSLGSYRYTDYDYPEFNKYIRHLNGLNEVIIEDSNTAFSIYGFYAYTLYPAFGFTDLNYYYIGRPLINIKSCVGLTIAENKDYGHIHTLEIAGYCTENPYFYQEVDTLILGTGIKKFIRDNLCTNSLSKIVCRSIAPPTISGSYSNFTTKHYTDVIVCVPYGCKEAYENANFWKNFWNIEELPEITAEEIILSVSEATIPINETVTIDATILPAETSDKSITWISSNPGVAEVSEEGIVKGISVGTATITAMCGAVSATCTVTVSEASEINSVTAVQNHKIQVYNLQGILIGSCNNKQDLNTLPKGVYIVVSNGKRSKIKI